MDGYFPLSAPKGGLSMTSIDEFYFRYYANRLLREGYIDQKEYQALMTANQLDCTARERHTHATSFQKH